MRCRLSQRKKSLEQLKYRLFHRKSRRNYGLATPLCCYSMQFLLLDAILACISLGLNVYYLVDGL